MIPGLKSTSRSFKDEEPRPRLTNKHQSNGVPEEVGDRAVFTVHFLWWLSSQNLKLNEDINIQSGGVRAVPMDVCQGENLSQEPKEKENKNKKMSNWHCWTDKVSKTSRKQKKKFRPIERVWEAGQGTGKTFCFFFFSTVLEQFFPLSEFGLFVWEFGSNLQEWKQIRQADFKQTVQDMVRFYTHHDSSSRNYTLW